MPEEIRKIAICGGGIGGLTLAAILCRNCDISVDVYEAKSEISQTGATIAIWKRPLQVLQDLGLEAEMVKRNLYLPRDGEVRGPIFRYAGRPETGFDFHSHMMPYGPTAIPRPALVEMLQELIDSRKCTIHTSKRLVDYQESQDGAVVLDFADGTTASADVLVGADGVHSMARASMFRSLAATSPSKGYDKFIDPIWSGTYAYRGTVNLAVFREAYPNHQAIAGPKIWCGKNKHVVTQPVGKNINLVCFSTVDRGGEFKAHQDPWVMDVPPAEVINTFEGWEPDLVKLLKYIEKPSRWAVHVIRPLPFVVSGHVALLGDSAHAMTPHQGIGGGETIEDAYILGRLLAHPSARRSTLPDLLRIYEEVRLPRFAKAVERSHDNGLIYGLMHPKYPVDEGAANKGDDLKALGEAIGESFSWLADVSLDEDWNKAEAMLLALR